VPAAPAPAANPKLEGVGLGLRWDFLEEVVDGPLLDLAFLEVSPENYMRRGGYYPSALEQLAERYPIVTHGLTLSLGAVEPPAVSYLDALKTEIARVASPWHSDHLCFSTAGGHVLHELLPLQHSKANASRVAARVREMSDRLGVPMAVENISWYVPAGRSEIEEEDFIARVIEESGAGLLLDVNNVYVNSLNHGFDPYRFIGRLPLERVVQIHVAGHERSASGLVVDTHGATVADPVIELLEWTLERTGRVPVLLERDNDLPELAELLHEIESLSRVYERAVIRHEERHARTA
jgi:uncharacterized protein